MIEPTRVKIVEQGSPRVDVDGGLVLRRGDGVAAVIVELHSKRCAVDAHGPELFLRATPESLHLDEGQPREKDTVIELPDFAGWNVWLAEVSKRTLCVCLIRELAGV